MQRGDQEVRQTPPSGPATHNQGTPAHSSHPSYPAFPAYQPGSSHPSHPALQSQHQTIMSTSPIPVEGNEVPSVPGAFGMHATTPALTDPQMTMQRADEINTIQRMMGDKQTSAVMIIGAPGTGKSTLVALLYRRLQLAKREHLPTPTYIVWLTIGTYTTLPDIIATILKGVNAPEPGLFLLKPEQQISALLRALRRPHENALIILDQFELLLHPETTQGAAGRGVLPLFMDMLQTDLGTSRILLTGYHLPYDESKINNPRVRSYLVTRISMPEGVALLQQRGTQGSPEELSLLWQRCAGQVFALVLCSAVIQLSGFPLDYLLNTPEYKPLWSGDVTLNLIIAVHYFLTPTQSAIMHALSLFHEPVPKEGIFMTITGGTMAEQRQSGYGESVTIFETELSRLVQYGLSQPVANNEYTAQPPNYTLHPLLRQHMLEHFMEDNSQSRNEGRAPLWSTNNDAQGSDNESRESSLAAGHVQVASYYQHVIDERCPPRELRTGLHDIGPIIATIRHLCLGRRWQRACDLLFSEGLHESMVQWGAWNTLIGLYTAMLPPFGHLQRADEGMVASHVGMLYGRIGEHQQSKVYFDQALHIQRQIGDHYGEAVTLANQGELLRVRGERQTAQQSFETALTLLGTTEDQALHCVIVHNLGLLAQQSHDYNQAHQRYNEAVQLALQAQRPDYTGMIMTNLGMLLYEQHHYQEGLAVLFDALSTRQHLQDPTVTLLERFLIAIEQKMGSDQYTQLSKEAMQIQSQVLADFLYQNTN